MSSQGIAYSIWLVCYVIGSIGAGSLALYVQRRFFLHADEDQSFAIPGITVCFFGLMYFWLFVTSSNAH